MRENGRRKSIASDRVKGDHPGPHVCGPGFLFIEPAQPQMPAQLAHVLDDPPAAAPVVDEVVVGGPVRDGLRGHAARAWPHEACGLLIGRVDGTHVFVTRALPCPNQAPLEERHHRFSIDPRAVINVRRSLRGTGESIVGFYHSHTDGRAVPSALDLEHIRLWPETVWAIVPQTEGEGEPGPVRVWWLDDGAREVRELSYRVAALSTGRMVCPD